MEYYFKEWVMGLFEDDPLPYEIKYLCFIITLYQDRCELSLTGSERPFTTAYPQDYYPLEAQCFFLSKYFNLRPCSRQKIYNITKRLILDVTFVERNNIHFRPNGRFELQDITISLGFRGKKADFLVKL